MLLGQTNVHKINKFKRQANLLFARIIDAFKKLWRKAKHHPFYLIILLMLILIIGFIAALPINSVELHISNQKLINQQDKLNYMNLVKGKHFFTKSSDTLAKIILKNDPKLKKVIVNKKLPGHIVIYIQEKKYIAKFKLNNKMYALTEDQQIIPLTQEQYKSLNIPFINKATAHNIQILKNKITQGLILLQQAITRNNLNISIIEITPITDKWHIPTIEIRMQNNTRSVNNFTVLFSPQKPADLQIQHLIAFLLGAKRQDIHYSKIDLRFDRLVIK